MSKTILPCRRFCCARKANARSAKVKIEKGSPSKTTHSNQTSAVLFPQTQPISQQSGQSIHSDIHIPWNNETNTLTNPSTNALTAIDLDRLTKEYFQTINEYRFQLGFSSLELSNELTERALHRARELSSQNHVENSNRFDLIHDDQPIGETVMSCRAPVTSGADLAKSIHNQLISDLQTGQSSKKRYTPILNPDCRFLGFGIVRNEEKTRDYIVSYYYPVHPNEELWQINDDSITQ